MWYETAMRRSPRFRIAAAGLAIVLCAWGARATVEVNPGDDLYQVVEDAQASGETDILINGSSSGPGTDEVYPLTDTLVINQKVTIRGNFNYLPNRIEIQGPGADTDCGGNIVVNPGFEIGPPHDPWLPEPEIIITDDPAYHPTPDNDGWYARFEEGMPGGDILRQIDIPVPPEPVELSFWLRMEQPGAPSIGQLNVFLGVDPIPVVTFTEADLAVYGGAWTEFGPLPVSPPAGPTELRFEAILPAGAPIFLVDGICFAPSSGTSFPVIEIEDGGDLTLENVALTNGGIGVHVMGSGALNMDRCFVRDITGPGVELAGPSPCVITSSVILRCDTAVHVADNGGLLNVVQCTLLENRGPGIQAESGVTNVVATLFADNASPAFDVTVGEVRSYSNYISPDEPLPPGVTVGFPNVTFVDGMPNFEDPTDWDGKLTEAVLTEGFTFDVAPEVDVPEHDFEFQRREGNVQVGADHYSITADDKAWVDCIVDPVVYIDNRARYVALGSTIDASLRLPRFNLDITRYYLVPESWSIDQALQPLEGTAEIVGDTANVTWQIPGTFVSDGSGGVICLDGLASIYVVEGTVIFGWNSNENILDAGVAERSRFIIDTTPPVFSEFSLTERADSLTSSNDTLPPNLAYGPYPGDWEPTLTDTPSSFGTLDASTLDPQIFLNTAPLDLLDLGIGVIFVDPHPVYDGTPYIVEPAGFRNDWPAIDSATDGLTPEQVLYDSALMEDAVTGEDVEVTGIARWLHSSAGAAVLTAAGLSARATYSDWAGPLDGALASEARLYAVWDVSNAVYFPGWHLATLFTATDIAGNPVQSEATYHAWWMRDARAEFTSGPSGQEEDNPVFTWQPSRVGSSPDNTNPSWPIARFRIWYAESPGLPAATGWIAAEGWSTWTYDKTFDRSSVLPTGLTLGELLDQTALSQQTVLITLQGADEAGNLQPLPGSLLGSNLTGLDVLQSGGFNVDYRYWINPGPLAVQLGAGVQARFWHNQSDGSEVARRRVDAGERDFSSSTRIPLPLENSCARVEGRFTITFALPDAIPPNYSALHADIQFVEDGLTVATGIIAPDPATGAVVLQIPEDILNPANPERGILAFASPNLQFLNAAAGGPCAGIFDRLGDEGPLPANRRKDVEYVLTVRPYVQTPAPDSIDIYGDPASISFTVFVPQEIQDEQPVKERTSE